ncbi:hypothetical protein KCM76_10805 [Zooshikella marina]|uniref:Uncharacterized protein n=1 Tax=Zooshikella ganghwensis TaxID=202772 RepID=A0A4V1IN28_9GAMM|nr:hypothetical protein [Zooshikella ganghwensis]MBU2706476.1 hypothetical protein [Zooshikella ganghwensis]RDH42281.1 hypothetical protein B9G39_01820 [Zooshikella ganghwensis]
MVDHLEEKKSYGQHWHLDKNISITHIISTFAVVISLFTWGGSIDKRIDQNSQSIGHLAEMQQRQDQRITDIKGEIRADLQLISNKLDRLIESKISN